MLRLRYGVNPLKLDHPPSHRPYQAHADGLLWSLHAMGAVKQ